MHRKESRTKLTNGLQVNLNRSKKMSHRLSIACLAGLAQCQVVVFFFFEPQATCLSSSHCERMAVCGRIPMYLGIIFALNRMCVLALKSYPTPTLPLCPQPPPHPPLPHLGHAVLGFLLTSLIRAPMWSAVSGVCSAGLMTTVLPQHRAGAIFHVNINRGKFH